DGNNLVDLHVRLTVTPPPPLSITTTSLPDGETGRSYAHTIQTTGGTGAISLSVTSGQLPPGLAISTGGSITGTPTQAGLFNFTVQAADAQDTATQTYNLRIKPPNLPPPGTDTGGEAGCTIGMAYSGQHTSSPANNALALAALALLIGAVRRQCKVGARFRWPTLRPQ